MRNLIAPILLLIICMISCRKDKTPTTLNGHWYLVEYQSGGIGPGPPPPVVVKNVDSISLTFTNNMFTKSRYDTLLCSGRYNIIADTLIFSANCVYTYEKSNFKLSGDTLFLRPAATCTEGCGYEKYIKMRQNN